VGPITCRERKSVRHVLTRVTTGDFIRQRFGAGKHPFAETDRFGRPLMRMTIDFHDNELKMSAFLTNKYAEILQKMGAMQVATQPRKGPYDVTDYQTSHLCGGAIMGEKPDISAVNRYLQSWDVPNLFVFGASAFPQNAGYNPTDTVGALAYWAAKAIRSQYLKNPGPLIHA
jgi:gluconate 2-dehydrogenase alpha chain